MNLYIIQHGLAFSKEEDPNQSLNPQGKEIILKAANILKRLNVNFDFIYSSHKTRAYQSAEIIAETLNYPVENIIKDDVMNPLSHPQDIVSLLINKEVRPNILLVGHLPSLQKLLSYILLKNESDTIEFNITNGGINMVSIQNLNKPGKLEFILPPSLF